MGLVDKLPPVTEKQRKYAFDNLFERVAVYKPRKREVKCLCCGDTTVWDKPFLESFIDVDEFHCMNCGRSMRMKYADKNTQYREFKFFTVLTTFRGYQVARTYEVSRCNYRDTATIYDIDEVYQIWLDDEGGEVITGRRHHRGPFYLTWDFHLPWEIKRHNPSCGGMYQFEDMFDLTGCHLYPDVRVTRKLRRNGWINGLMRYQNAISMADAMRWLLTVPTAEMLVKTGQWDLFLWMVRRADMQIPFLHSVRIANRNNYIVKDAQTWFDYLNMGAELGMDTHNPKIVCPEDLIKAHDAVLKRVARRRKLKQAEKERLQAINSEKYYRESKGKYFGIMFSSGDISIKVLTSVAEFVEEGRAMHHCVFAGKYFNKKDSLILSAKDSEGNRLETVELSLKTFKVLQSRARFNQESPLHSEIIRLVEDNVDLFKQVV